MAQFQTAKILHNNLPIVVAQVQAKYINSKDASDHVFAKIAREFATPNIVLMNKRNGKIRGTRKDIVEFASTLDTKKLKWQEWEFEGECDS